MAVRQSIDPSDVKAPRPLIACGALAGALFLVIFLLDAIMHPTFDLIHQEPSLLSIGPLGWIQVVNLVTAGLLIMKGAVGARRILGSSKGALWGPLLLGVFGFCEVGVGIFVVDPPSPGHSTTFHGTLHLAFGGVGFVALIAACFVFARAFFVLKQKHAAIFSAVIGLEFLVAFLAAAAVSQRGGNIQPFLNVTVVLEWISVSFISTRLMKIN